MKSIPVSIEIELDGKKFSGSFVSSATSVTVSSIYGTAERPLNGTPDHTVAHQVLRELARAYLGSDHAKS